MNPATDKKLYDLDLSLWSITRVLKHCPHYRKQMWALISDKDKAAIKQAVADSKS